MIYTNIDKRASRSAFFIFKGKPSYDYNILVKRLPDIISPEKRVEKITVPGRNGYLYEDSMTFSETDKIVECFIRDTYYLNEISAWLKGNGNVIFSNEKEKYYNAIVMNAIPFSKFAASIKAFPVIFNCKPFKYNVSYENDFITVFNDFHFFGKGTFNSEPVITIFGHGNIVVYINDKTIQLNNVSEYIVINSEIMDAYKGNENQNMKMIGEFPLLNANGEVNTIRYTGNVNKVEIIPNWRWL